MKRCLLPSGWLAGIMEALRAVSGNILKTDRRRRFLALLLTLRAAAAGRRVPLMLLLLLQRLSPMRLMRSQTEASTNFFKHPTSPTVSLLLYHIRNEWFSMSIYLYTHTHISIYIYLSIYIYIGQ